MTDRIRYADYGYAGLFDADKVDEAVLDQLYQFDVPADHGRRRDRDAGRGAQRRQPVAQERPGLLEDKIEALGTQFSEREHLITGAGR